MKNRIAVELKRLDHIKTFIDEHPDGFNSFLSYTFITKNSMKVMRYLEQKGKLEKINYWVFYNTLKISFQKKYILGTMDQFFKKEKNV